MAVSDGRTYRDFLASKAQLARSSGVALDVTEVNPRLKPHARAIVPWAVRGGRRAIFARFGLQKTSIQLEILRILGERTGGPVLAVVPLGVRQEFRRDADEYFWRDGRRLPARCSIRGICADTVRRPRRAFG